MKAGFMVPHPPLIIPQVGRGSEKQVAKTISSYEKVAEEIASIKPETIVITSPHSIMYSDYFHISPGRSATGSFASFDAPEVSFSEEYDTELVSEIEKLAKKKGFPAGTMGERDRSLDHGTMVPLYFIRQKYTGFKIVRIGLSGLDLLQHYSFGQIIEQAVSNLGRRTVIVASGDLSHKLQPHGPYGFAKEGPEYDGRLMDVCERCALDELLGFDEDFCEKAAECGHRSFVIMAGCFDGRSVSSKVYSHEDVTGVGYGIASFYPGEKSEKGSFLDIYRGKVMDSIMSSRAREDEYVRLARRSLESYIRTGEKISVPADASRELTERRAGAFVSIHKNGRLRGCIGTIGPVTDSIANEIIDNAISASTADPRFSPITEDELEWLEISVDVLGEIEDISSPDELDVKRYGVIVSKGGRRGLLLPNLDGVDTVEEQIDIARRKGGIAPGESVKLQRFEVVRHY